MISWPGTFGTLQTNSDLTTSNWGVYGGAVSNSNGTNSVTLAAHRRQPCFPIDELNP